jgi:APA family basic amino acid/polyamine antiporter
MDIDNKQIKKIGLVTTSAFVIANMIGVGVFTSLGFQLNDISNVLAILALWLIGGILALCGALVYSELGAAMPRSGGEYHYLSKIYHPWIGFLSGIVSITVGFAAPVAAIAMALGGYVNRSIFPIMSPEVISIVTVLIITWIHSYDIGVGGNFQKIFTGFKILLIIVFILCGILITKNYESIIQDSVISFSLTDFLKNILRPEFAVALVWVTYSYSGWNASAYIASEIKQPQKTIPKSLLYSTLIVTALYFFLNFTFLLTTPVNEMIGIKEIGYVSGVKIFGSFGGSIMALLISILLISTISSMIFVGPRVSQVMGEDIRLLKVLAHKSKKGIPLNAIILQTSISILLIITATFDFVVVYIGFTLNLFTFLAVLGVFIHRYKFPNIERPYKTWGYPVIPIIFLAITLWILVFTFYKQPAESILGFVTVILGSVFYWISIWADKKKQIIK